MLARVGGGGGGGGIGIGGGPEGLLDALMRRVVGDGAARIIVRRAGADDGVFAVSARGGATSVAVPGAAVLMPLVVWAGHLRIRPRRIHDHAKGHLPRPTSRGTGRDETDESAAEVRVSRAYEAAVETGTGEPRERRRGGWRRRRIFGNRETATGVDVGANPTNSTNRTFAGDVRAPA